MQNKLFVGNLSFQTTEGVLMDAFAAYGAVTDAFLMTDQATGRSRGSAFVTMSSDQAAGASIRGLKGMDLDGRTINFSIARPREERPGGGGGGGGGVYRGGGGGGGGGYRGGGGG